MLTALATADDVLRAHSVALGGDLPGYRHHVYRVVNLCVLLSNMPADRIALEKIEVAAVYHDLGIWTHGTFDYVQPSVDLAMAHLADAGRHEWAPEVAAMIREHHKVRAYRGSAGPLVESFRRADWIDVTCGLRTFGLSRARVRTIRATWANDGFHARLLSLSASRLRTHPWSPLPMLRF